MLKVAIFNNCLGVFGGGERVTCALAHSLSTLGYAVDLLSFEERVPTREELSEAFGPGHDGYRVVPLRAEAGRSQDQVLTEHLHDYAIFINNTAGSSFRNPCPLGVYMVMFPFQAGGDWVDSYHHLVCNSEYTAFYTRQRWGAHHMVSVLYPCAEEHPGHPREVRELEVVTVGRFNVSGHNKNQALLVDAFKRALPLLPGGWRLTVVGRINPGEETRRYVDEMVAGCRGLPVHFEFNASEQTKAQILSRAALYWSGTGVGLGEPWDAARMEHFGISIVEAMAAGCIPLALDRGGPREIIRNAVDGFLYTDLEQLVTCTALLALHPPLRERMRRAASERAQTFNRRAFDASVARFFERVVAA